MVEPTSDQVELRLDDICFNAQLDALAPSPLRRQAVRRGGRGRHPQAQNGITAVTYLLAAAVRRCRDELFERLVARLPNFGADDADGALSQDMTNNIQDIRILCPLCPCDCCVQKPVTVCDILQPMRC